MADNFRIERWVDRNVPNPAMLRLRMEHSGYRATQWCDQPGAFYGMRKYAETRSHWIVSGRLEITILSNIYLLEPGDRGYLPAETYHSARVVGDDPVVYLLGEQLPPKKKRGRPKKAKPADEDELPPEVQDLSSRFGIES